MASSITDQGRYIRIEGTPKPPFTTICPKCGYIFVTSSEKRAQDLNDSADKIKHEVREAMK